MNVYATILIWVSRHFWQLSIKEAEQAERKKVNIFLFWWKRRKAEKTQEITRFDFFAISEIKQ